MITTNLQTALAALGLTPNAIALYEQSFLTGRSTVGRLAALAEMDRSSAHLAATQLRGAGLLNEEVVGERTYIWVKPPKDVLVRLKIAMNHLQTQYESVEDALPALSAGYQAAEKLPVVQVFSGKSGLKQVVANVLENAADEILLFTNQAFEREVFSSADHRDFINERKRRGIKIRALAVDTTEGHDLQAADDDNLRQTRLISGETTVPFKNEIYIYGDSVAMLSFSGQVFGFVTRSADFAEAQLWAFERLWREAA
ncbi:hypothetical protein HJC99_04230 [Candidatus Saccharibacteria bacterium]|nr:hypothetical protein [Candidatus Saccharibacteria bacterium]